MHSRAALRKARQGGLQTGECVAGAAWSTTAAGNHLNLCVGKRTADLLYCCTLHLSPLPTHLHILVALVGEQLRARAGRAVVAAVLARQQALAQGRVGHQRDAVLPAGVQGRRGDQDSGSVGLCWTEAARRWRAHLHVSGKCRLAPNETQRWRATGRHATGRRTSAEFLK